MLAYLTTDDAAIRRPLKLDEVASAFPGADRSFAVLMRYARQQPLGRDFRAPTRIYNNPGPGEAPLDPAKPEPWALWLKNHRSDIEAGWAELAPLRAWWAELNTFDRIGDLTPSRPEADMIAFSPIRALSQHACSIAGLQALDGNGDAAIDTVTPILEVSRKLQSSSRTLVRGMIGIVAESTAQHTIAFILDRATVSPAARSRLAAVLAASGGGPAGARHLVAAEYAWSQDFVSHYQAGELLGLSGGARHVIDTLSPLFYNPRASMNLRGEIMLEEQELLANRQLEQMDALDREVSLHRARPGFKNFLGTLILGRDVPSYRKIGENYWKVQDRRNALLARVAVL